MASKDQNQIRPKWSNFSHVIGRAVSPSTSPTIIRKVNKTSTNDKSSLSTSSTASAKSKNSCSGSGSEDRFIVRGCSPTPSSTSPTNSTMAASMSFNDWRQASGDSLMNTAENLLDKLEDVAELLTEIDSKYITCAENEEVDDARASIIQRFHDGVESARNVVGVLKREKWRLSKREMSVELKMGELEDYKSHLQNDMSSLNQTVDVLSLRIVQLENQLVEAQEVQESLEAEVAEHKRCIEEASHKCAELQKKNFELTKELKHIRSHTPQTLAQENSLLKNEVVLLQDENHKLKDLVRRAETHPKESEDDNLARLTRDFLRELSSLEVENAVSGGNSASENNNVEETEINCNGKA